MLGVCATDSTTLASNQITTIHCTIRVYVIIHQVIVCDRFQKKQIGACFVLVIKIYITVAHVIIGRGLLNSINRFKLSRFVCLSQARGGISIASVYDVLHVLYLEERDNYSLCSYLSNCWRTLFNRNTCNNLLGHISSYHYLPMSPDHELDFEYNGHPYRYNALQHLRFEDTHKLSVNRSKLCVLNDACEKDELISH